LHDDVYMIPFEYGRREPAVRQQRQHARAPCRRSFIGSRALTPLVVCVSRTL
jgi:hypothetical protein